jgi:hypothetical protein
LLAKRLTDAFGLGQPGARVVDGAALDVLLAAGVSV